MKDLLIQKEALIPLCLAESPDLSLDGSSKPPDNGSLNVRRSATMLSLAISMGAAGMLFAPHKATATSSVSLHPAFSSINLPLEVPPSPVTPTRAIRSAEVPLLKSELKSGESIQKLTESYPHNSKAIVPGSSFSVQSSGAINNAHVLSTLENPQVLAATLASRSIALAIAANPTPEFDPSLEHLRETRKRLQESLTELQSEQKTATADEIEAQIPANDVSQPLHTADKTTPINSPQETPSNSFLVSGRPTSAADPNETSIAAATILEKEFNHPIPIPVPTPESVIPQATLPSRRLSPSPSLAVPSALNPVPTPLPQKEVGSLPKASGGSNPPTSSLTAFNQPIPLAVPTPASPSSLSTPGQKPELRLSTPQSIPSQPSDRPSADQTYQVRPGDTLNSIARRHGLSMEALIRANPITNPNVITVSQSLLIPTRSPQSPPSQSSVIAEVSLPINAPSSLTSAPARDRIEGAALNPQPIEISGVNPERTYTEKLKADVSNLNTTYGHPISPISIPVVQPPAPEAISSVPDGGDRVNSEWQSDRKQLTNQARSPQLPPLSRPSSAMVEGQLIGAAPTNVQEYNNNLRIPIGQEVTPELPPLSAPDRYLPDSPMQSSGYIWPAKGVLTSGFGWRWGRMHKGIDIAAPIGTPVLAAAPGEVISAGWNAGGYGNLVKILHADGSITLYAHNSRIFVQPGQQVAQGEQISAMGSTGFSTGPHLHFEVHPSGKAAVNPIAYLPSKGRNL